MSSGSFRYAHISLISDCRAVASSTQPPSPISLQSCCLLDAPPTRTQPCPQLRVTVFRGCTSLSPSLRALSHTVLCARCSMLWSSCSGRQTK